MKPHPHSTLTAAGLASRTRLRVVRERISVDVEHERDEAVVAQGNRQIERALYAEVSHDRIERIIVNVAVGRWDPRKARDVTFWGALVAHGLIEPDRLTNGGLEALSRCHLLVGVPLEERRPSPEDREKDREPRIGGGSALENRMYSPTAWTRLASSGSRSRASNGPILSWSTPTLRSASRRPDASCWITARRSSSKLRAPGNVGKRRPLTGRAPSRRTPGGSGTPRAACPRSQTAAATHRQGRTPCGALRQSRHF